MQRAISIYAIMILASVVLAVFFARHAFATSGRCLPYKAMWYQLTVIQEQPPLAVAVANPGLAIELHLSRAGAWTLLGLTDGAKTSCILLQGRDFGFLMTKKA